MIDYSKINKKDFTLISQIVKRAIDENPNTFDFVTFNMDLCAAHANDPLNLQGLLDFDKLDFNHDVFGISNNMNRETAQLNNHFVPRCAI